MDPESGSAGGRGAEADFQAAVRRRLGRNFVGLTIHGLLGQTGFRLIHVPTFIPAYVFELSGSNVAVGLARAFQSLGMFLSPILGATLVEHRRRVLPVGLAVGVLMRLQLLGLALAGFFLGGRYGLVATWLFLALFGFFLGMQAVTFQTLVAKVIPVERRGLLLGLRNALAGVTASAVGVAGGMLVESDALGNGYAATFLLAFGLTSAGLLCLLLVQEPASPTVRAATRVGQRLRELPALLRADRAFTLYFVARALGTMGRMGLPFYVIYAQTRLPIGGRELGWMSLAFLLAQSVGNLFWGTLADRRGFRLVFLIALALWVMAALLLMQANSIGALVVVMTALGAGVGGFMLAAQNLVLEFGSRENLPIRIAVANTATEAVGVVGPLLGGVLASVVSYPAVFWTAIAFQLVAMVMVLRHVDEPRRREPAHPGV